MTGEQTTSTPASSSKDTTTPQEEREQALRGRLDKLLERHGVSSLNLGLETWSLEGAAVGALDPGRGQARSSLWSS
eukprot:CAMPEP_0175950976 /NCGR_PEP_ID=MMETSP0108-20121206/29939_1 /TAXON_ID=195067 ORGANISM="Goniomonas pacifica, Strain CCMP1869" /NCGR_SAMPLE_ID=MMETSP0108 /ASSEMBLY_ACC=CAM_ASM_000204 /LENGTH=75 /DNA_ID=CAMNT_0017277175 /DNA_START=12 /DNA_END=239 /DNA_ORIENTATION=+